MVRSLTLKRLKEALDYNPRTGEFKWRINQRGRYARAGVRAGGISLSGSGYRQICIDCVIYGEGPLAMFYMTGNWPKLVDHINGNKTDNRWRNLREATASQNIANSRETKNKMYSALKGVTFDKRSGRYMAQIKVNYRPIYLGRFNTAGEAHAAYIAAARKYFGEFARA